MPRNCVLTVQGGGALGIDLIGQIQGVIGKRALGDREMDVLGIAGTSAGAIIATLTWAGYTPFSIRDIVKTTFSEEGRERFFGDFDPAEIGNFGALLLYLNWCEQALRGRWFDKIKVGLSIFVRKRWAWRKQGILQSQGFERTIDALLRLSPIFQGHFDGAEYAGRFLTFGDIDGAGVNVVPLSLMVTDLDRRTLVVVDSMDRGCHSLAVATAVRASAGFPIFFRPVQLGPHRICIDGGVISNAPSWVFSRAFREKLREAGRHGDRVAARRANAPWCHISLGLAQDDTPPVPTNTVGYLLALWSMLSGIGRRTLEETMFALVATKGFKIVPQAGQGPRGVLDFGALTDVNRIDESFGRGRAAARTAINEAAFAPPDPGAIGPILLDLVLLVTEVLERYLAPGSLVRANVFLPVSPTHMRIAYAVNMDGHDDIRIEVGLRRSVTSLCYEAGEPLLANLRDNNIFPDVTLEGADPFAPQVHPDRTWLLSIPVIDTLDTSPRRSDGPLSLDFVGPVLAVLNLDASIPYDKTGLPSAPRVQATHPAVRAVFDAAKIAALKVADVMNQFWMR